jgi:hypothetical protein
MGGAIAPVPHWQGRGPRPASPCSASAPYHNCRGDHVAVVMAATNSTARTLYFCCHDIFFVWSDQRNNKDGSAANGSDLLTTDQRKVSGLYVTDTVL